METLKAELNHTQSVILRLCITKISALCNLGSRKITKMVTSIFHKLEFLLMAQSKVQKSSPPSCYRSLPFSLLLILTLSFYDFLSLVDFSNKYKNSCGDIIRVLKQKNYGD
ncbi:unnamed protein product [Moneuplotes crassus]|uniref:Uncharacterized protein n=1 Tax=Euplotes crassus TaxID=5936 RepID=A0AAD1YAP0_EUPCR|nr:unnamed protein product [Moneuplotes crassus]